jgi:DNA topoisomerase-1
MKDAKGWTTGVDIQNGADTALFRATGTVITERGFLEALDDIVRKASGIQDDASTSDDSDNYNTDSAESNRLPNLSEGEAVDLVTVNGQGRETKPPARYTEARLVQKMEELGIGRPSTYASIISTIQDRGYVVKRSSALIPTWLAFAVTNVLETELTRYVDYDFTANMEEDLDEIAEDHLEKVKWLSNFYFGNKYDKLERSADFVGLREDVNGVLDKHKKENFSDDVFDLGNGYQVHMYRQGAYVEKVGTKPNDNGQIARGLVPVDLAPDEITAELAAKIVEDGSRKEEPLGINPATGYPIAVKVGKYGPYFTEILPTDVHTKGKGAVKPKMGSLLSYMDVDSVTIEDALKVFSLPRVLGTNPPDGEKISVQNGRFGPYMVKKDLDTKNPDYLSIRKTDTETAEERMFSVTLEEAIDEYSHPKIYRRRGARAK